MGLKIVIIGAGLGGLSCAISCRHQGFDVVVLEKAAAITAIGAGIQIPPNASKILQRYGLLDSIKKPAIVLEHMDMRRYQDGRLLTAKATGEEFVKQMGGPWMVIHRQDYHAVLLQEAQRLGVDIRLNANVTDLDFKAAEVILADGEKLKGDVVVGADGLWSTTRDAILGHPSPPVETGDLAYRATFTRKQLLELGDPKVEALCSRKSTTLWMGPDRHSVFYPLRGGSEFNLVLLGPDNLPAGAKTIRGDLDEMRATFEGWDPILLKLISCISSVLKWKLCHHQELEKWTKGRVALLGDACHPSLPYEAQGAAMAVEDGAVLGYLLGRVAKLQQTDGTDRIPSVLALYEKLRKSRTTVNVLGAINNRKLFHLPDGPEQVERDDELVNHDWVNGRAKWHWIDSEYQSTLLGFDALKDAEAAFEKWWADGEAESTK